MGERVPSFEVDLTGRDSVRKTAGGSIQSASRLHTEFIGLQHAYLQFPEIVPLVLSYDPGKVLEVEKVTRKKVKTPDVLKLIEDFQTIRDPRILPVAKSEDYKEQASEKAQDLFRAGKINEKMMGNMAVYLDDHADSLDTYETVFVHGDIQQKNLGWKNGRPVAFDLEQAHMGSELEDFVFYGISSGWGPLPVDRSRVASHLRDKFKDKPEKIDDLVEATSYMSLDRYLHVLHWNTFNKNPNLRNTAVALFAKMMISKILSADARGSIASFAQPQFESKPAKE